MTLNVKTLNKRWVFRIQKGVVVWIKKNSVKFIVFQLNSVLKEGKVNKKKRKKKRKHE